jgi:hypothetical protein
MTEVTRQCTAHRSCGRRCQESVEKGGQHSCGERCRKPAIRGGTVCMSHGGAAPQVRRSARQTLLEGADPVAARLVDQALAEGPPCATCGRGTADGAVLVRARTAVLDRAGLGPHSTVSVETGHAPSWVEFLTSEQLSRMGEWMDEAKARMASGEAPPSRVTVTVIEPGSPVDKFNQYVQAKKKALEAKEREAEPRPVLALVRTNGPIPLGPGAADEEE